MSAIASLANTGKYVRYIEVSFFAASPNLIVSLPFTARSRRSDYSVDQLPVLLQHYSSMGFLGVRPSSCFLIRSP